MNLRLRVRVLACLAVGCTAFILPAHAQTPQQQVDQCVNQGNAYSSDISINSCTALIQLGIRLGRPADFAYFFRGMAYNAKRDYDRAIADLSEAIRLDPDGGASYNERGYAFFQKRDFERAIADFSEVIRLDPKRGSASTTTAASRITLRGTTTAPSPT